MLAGKTLLITGGMGTFGNAVLSRFLESEIGEIRIFSRDEKKQHEMRLFYDSPKLRFYIGDVCNAESLRDSMIKVDFVFHPRRLNRFPPASSTPCRLCLQMPLPPSTS